MEEKINRNYFKNYQDEKVSKRVNLIEEYLTQLTKQKVQFKNITELAQQVSDFLTKKEGMPCNKSTLLRNNEYKNLLNNYLYNYGGGKNTNSYKKNNPIALLSAELSQSNAERENMRLKQYISNLEKELDTLKNNNKQIINSSNTTIDKDTIDFSLLCKGMSQLIQHFDGLTAINNDGELVDLSKKSNNIIINKETLKQYLVWSQK